MDIRYLCYNCSKKFGLSGGRADNEVGRKFCDNCNSNPDYLIIVSKDDFNNRIEHIENNTQTQYIDNEQRSINSDKYH